MGSKLGLILSLGIIFFAFLFGADLTMVQLRYTNLDSISTLASYRISKDGSISESLISYCLERDITILPVDESITAYQKGDTFEYYLKTEYQPLVMGDKPFDITIKRYAVISIYN